MIGSARATSPDLGAPHDYLARDTGLVRVLPDLRGGRSYWLAVHESLRDVAGVRAAAEFVTETA